LQAAVQAICASSVRALGSALRLLQSTPEHVVQVGLTNSSLWQASSTPRPTPGPQAIVHLAINSAEPRVSQTKPEQAVHVGCGYMKLGQKEANMDSKSESSPSCDSGSEGGGGEGGGEGGGGNGGGGGGDGEVWPDCAVPPASERLSSKPSRSQAHTRWLACRRHLLGGPDASTVSAAAAEAAAVLRADEPRSSPNALGAAPGRPRRHASAGSAGLWSNPSPAARAARRRRTRFATRAIKKKSRLADDSPSCAAIGPGGLRPDRACTVSSQPVCVSSAAVLGAVTSVWAVTSDGWRGGRGGS
jgi:hypothetical protein